MSRYQHLAQWERYTITHYTVRGYPLTEIARVLGRSPSTISREIERNGGDRRYRAARADIRAWDEAKRPKRCKLARHPCLRQAVERKLRHNWAPEQIAGWLKTTYPDNEAYHVSHETICRYEDASAALS